MSDYHVYLKNGSENVEIDIPDIYKDPDSETNSDQIRTFISNDMKLNYLDLEVDIKRNGRFKRKCSDCEIIDGDEVYLYRSNKAPEMDLSKIKLKTGYVNIIDKQYHGHNFQESDLKIILSTEDNHRDKISEILKILQPFIATITCEDDLNFISNLSIFNHNSIKIGVLPYNSFDGKWYFGYLNSSKLPCGYGYCFDHSTMTYYEGNFSQYNIFNGKSLCLSGENYRGSYYTTGDFYSNFKQNNRGYRKYLFRNEIFIGTFKDDMYSGGSRLITDIGEYIGIFSEGKCNGYGMMIYKNGDQYMGYWYNNRKNCFGKMKYKSGDYYSGTWEDDRKEVFGNYFDSDMNVTYIGTFKDDKRTFIKDEYKLISGNSFLTDHIGEHEFTIEKKIIDEIEKIKKSAGSYVYEYGKLMYTNFNTDVIDKLDSSRQTFYIGHYDSIGCFYGIGKLYYNYSKDIINNTVSPNTLYSKDHEKDKFKGYRCYHSLFDNGYPNGYGMINYEDGSRYIGSITNGKLNGKGLFIKSNGERIRALWFDGNIVEIKEKY